MNSMPFSSRAFPIFFLYILPLCGFGQYFLPPTIPWNGKTENLIVPKNDPWITPAEKSDFKTTPTYSETIAFLKRLSKKCPFIQLEKLGFGSASLPGFAVLVSREGGKKAADLSKNGKPTLLVQAGIHSGEIDGKDAGLMLLRDMALGKKGDLLDQVNFIFIPVLNPEGHESPSTFNRPNQRGPENGGLRTNSHNLNLNRDYMKQETIEIQSVISLIHACRPDLYLDIHVTDGADYQYDITYGYTGPHGHSPAISHWLDTVFSPFINKQLKALGHIPGPFLNATNDQDFSQGNTEITYGPNFSHGYGNLIHLPTVLVENHSLKPYRQRVLGTYALIEASLNLLAERASSLRGAKKEDEGRRDLVVPLAWKVPENTKPDSMEHLGIRFRKKKSEVTGAEYVEWLGIPETRRIAHYKMDSASIIVNRPKGYWIPSTHKELAVFLKEKHHIKMEVLEQSREVTSGFYKMKEPIFSSRPFEGRIQVKAKAEKEIQKFWMKAGSFFVSTDQPLGNLVVALLEPDSPESLFQWGYFSSVFQQTEYIESYFMEPIAKKMLEDSPQLREQFERKKIDNPAFASNPRAILEWFFEQSPYRDRRFRQYPIGRVE